MTILIAVGSGKVDVPDIVGPDRDEAEKALREKNLTLGQASPQPADPEGKIVLPDPGRRARSSRPARRSTSSIPTRPTPRTRRRTPSKEGQEGRAAARARSGGGGGGAGAADIVVPAIGKDDTLDAYAKKLGDLGIVPVVPSSSTTPSRARRSAPTRPAAPRSANGAKVKVLVSAGQPQVVFTNGKDILRVNGATAAKLDPVADRARRRRSTRPGPRTAARRLHRRRPGDAQGPHEEERGAGAADARRASATPTSRGRRPPTST